MKLKEILKDSGQFIDEFKRLPKFDSTTTTLAARFDRVNVLHSTEFNNQGLDAYGITDTHGVVSYVLISTTDSNVRTFHELWTRPDQRQRGYATALLMCIVRKLGYKLHVLNNEIVTDESRIVIYKAVQHGKLKALNGLQQPHSIESLHHALFDVWGRTDDEIVLEGHQIPRTLLEEHTICADGSIVQTVPATVYVIPNEHGLD